VKFRVEVNTFGDPDDSWSGNAITHASRAQAKWAAENLFDRWTAVQKWRVLDQNDKVVLEGPDEAPERTEDSEV